MLIGLRIYFDYEGFIVPEGSAYDVMKQIVDLGNDVTIGSVGMIHALRLLVLERCVRPDGVSVLFNGNVYLLNEYGNFEDDSFLLDGAPESMVFKILRLQVDKAREDGV